MPGLELGRGVRLLRRALLLLRGALALLQLEPGVAVVRPQLADRPEVAQRELVLAERLQIPALKATFLKRVAGETERTRKTEETSPS